MSDVVAHRPQPTTTPWGVFAIASGAVFLVSVDTSIAVAAYPALRAAFADTLATTLAWVLTAYTILYAALLVPAGRLVDLYGAKRLFLLGVAIFMLASAACGLAPDIASLVGARVVQAIGGALLTPASLTLVLGAFPASKRSSMIGLWSAAGALGAAVGPGAGAILIEVATWRAAFLVNLPVGIFILYYARRQLPLLAGGDTGKKLDIIGVFLIASGIALLVYGVMQMETESPTSPAVWTPAAFGMSMLAGYVIWARGRTDPAIDMSLFADRTYALVTAASFIFGVAFSMMFLTSFLFLIGIWDFSQGLTGLAVTPGPLVVIAVAMMSGRLVARIGHRAVLITGGLLYSVTQMWIALNVTATPEWLTFWFPLQLIGGASVGLLLVGLSGAAVAGLAPTRFGVGGAVNNATRQLGGVFGTTLAVLLVGQLGTDIEGFRTAFFCLAALGLLTAVFCLPLSGESGKALNS